MAPFLLASRALAGAMLQGSGGGHAILRIAATRAGSPMGMARIEGASDDERADYALCGRCLPLRWLCALGAFLAWLARSSLALALERSVCLPRHDRDWQSLADRS